MYGSYDGSEVPSLTTYAQASEYEANIKPYRGRPNDPKPIERRSKTAYTIWRDPENCIRVRHHRTDILTFTPQGDIKLNLGGWDSMTTIQYINQVLPRLYLAQRNGRVICDAFYTQAGEQHAGEFIVQKNSYVRLRFDRDTQRFEIFNPTPCYQHKVDRKRLNEVRRECKPLCNYIANMCAVRAGDNGQIPVTHEVSSRRFREKYFAHNMSVKHLTRQTWRAHLLSESIDTHAEIMEALIDRNATYSWTANGRTFGACTKDIMGDLDYVVKFAFADTGIFKSVTLPWGTVREDKNGRTFHL